MLWTADTVMYRNESMYAAYSGNTLIWHNSNIVATEATSIDTSSTYIMVAGDKIAVTDDLVYTSGTMYNNSSLKLQSVPVDAQGNIVGVIPSNAFKFSLIANTAHTDYYKIVSGGGCLCSSDEPATYNLYINTASYPSGYNDFYIKKELIRDDKVVKSVNYYNIYLLVDSGGSSVYTAYGKNWGYNSTNILFKYISNLNQPGNIPRIFKVL